MPAPIRIMHVVEAVGIGGGVETGIGNLIERMDPDRFEHVLCAVFRVGTQLERYPLARIRLISLERKARKLATQTVPLVHLIRQVQPDVVHSRNWGALEAVIAGRWTRSCLVIHSEHGFETIASDEPPRRSWFRRAAFELAHRVFSVSYQLRNTLAKRTGFSPHRIHVIHNGVDVHTFQKDAAARSSLRREMGISEEELCIGCVGRLNQIKDYPTVLRAVALFSKTCNSWRLLIAGDGPDRQALQDLINADPALQGRVCFMGPIRRVAAFLSALDVYVLPSIAEGISNSLLEAMAAGLPALASKSGGTPEVIVDGESGLLFPVGDDHQLAGHLIHSYHDREFRDRLAYKGLQRVTKEFSLAFMVNQYAQMYEGLTRSFMMARVI